MEESEKYSVVPFGESAFFECFSNPKLTSAAVAGQKRAQYLYRYLKTITAQTIVVENDYIDRDYLDDFAAYYVRCFQQYERRCRRLHFFSTQFEEAKLLKIIQGESPTSLLTESYLGFIVVRPLPSAIVGRTVLKVDNVGAEHRHYPCRRTYGANLFGVDLQTESLAFQEQDSVLAACATVALWCCFHKTADMFDASSPSPAQITRAANQIAQASRPIPSHGLNVQQICNAINHVGLEPEVIRVQPNTPLVSLIYGHVAFGLPVILGLDVEGVGGHAVTVVGYSIEETAKLPREVGPDVTEPVPMVGLRIDRFFAHDDQIGPFSEIVIKPSITTSDGKTYPVSFEGDWIVPTTGKPRALQPTVVIIPVYHKIRVTFLDIQKWLTRMSVLLKLLVQSSAAYEWDVRLTTTNEYKRELSQSSLHRREIERLRIHSHPRFIWRSILRIEGKEAMELLADATDMARSFPIYLAIWHSDEFRKLLELLLKMPITDLLKQSLTEPFWEFLSEETKVKN